MQKDGDYIESWQPHDMTEQQIEEAKHIAKTIDREGIRRLAAETLGLATAGYEFANTYDEFIQAAAQIGFPCVVKPLMSSSGKGQSVCRSEADLESCWETAMEGGRVKNGRVIDQNHH